MPQSALRPIDTHCGDPGDRRGGGEGQYGLRQWENDDLVPRPDDIFQERLYCVRWHLPKLADLLWAEQYARYGEDYPRPVPDWVPLDTAIASLSLLAGALENDHI